MQKLTRRQFSAALAFGAYAPRLAAKSSSLDDVLRNGIAAHKIPCAAAMVADSNKILYQGAFGTRDSSGAKIDIDSIFAIASMTKAITSTAALQLVERGLVTLDEPVERHLPQLRGIGVLTGYDANGQPVLRPPATKITLRHLLSHTSGLCYGNWDKDMARWQARPGAEPLAPVAPVTPLMFDPGTRWQYGTGIDFAGKLVEALTGQPLEDYFQRYILGPLEMKDTSFILQPAKFERLVSGYRRGPDGALVQNPRTQPNPPKDYNGGGGLFSTCGDYTRFMQMILRYGTRSSSGSMGQVLSAKTVAAMSTNQSGNNRAGVLKTTNPAISADLDAHPGASDRYTVGFLLNPEPHEGGRSAGSLAWAGIYNTFYWIDPVRDRCAVLMMQFLPFVDKEAIAMLDEFERAVYVNM
jgi:CubicO group peptidase (beta-lactamase class C family)